MKEDTVGSHAQTYYKDEAIRHLETANKLNEELRLIISKNRILGEVQLQKFLN